ncbi:MAG: hypothetical protein ABWX84_07500 [Nocardioides sp.]
MTTPTVVATANVHWRLPAGSARRALEDVLDQGPDLVGLQEWGLSRLRLLRETGSVGLVPDLGIRLPCSIGGRASGYTWSAPVLGGCPVGARADRFQLTGCRWVVLSGAGRAARSDQRFRLRRARLATVATYRDLRAERPVSVVCYHLTPGVQALGRYREDRPQVVARHRQEVRRLQDLVDALLARGHDVHALGDSNLDGFRLRGLTSAWQGREDEPGTLGAHRKVDDVHSSVGRAIAVTRLTSDSDHQAVIVNVRRTSSTPGDNRRPSGGD